jgi:hypothetical protein
MDKAHCNNVTIVRGVFGAASYILQDCAVPASGFLQDCFRNYLNDPEGIPKET